MTSSATPPDGLPVYRLLTGPDDASFCRRVSETIAQGYRLYGSPAATFNGENVIVAQAVVWPSVPGEQPTMNPATLQALAEFPRQLVHFYEAVPEAYRRWSPPSWEGIPSENFTAIGQLCHVRDIEIDGYHVRLERTLHEDKPVLASLDGYLLAEQRNYQDANAADVLSAFAAARDKTLQIISALTAAELGRGAVFEGYGELTLRSLVHYLCSHDQQHLAGLQWLLGKIDVARAATQAT